MQPMLATPAAQVGGAARLPYGPEWRFEVKWDGVRILAEHTGDGLRLVGRNGRDATAAYPELEALAAALPPGTVLDGEVLALRDGVPSFVALAE
ncbi:DNA ligase, partial [Cellulomonas hominis]|nr:DNA ligase [Cellulomonas hominis]